MSKHLTQSLICGNKEMSNANLHSDLHSTWCNLASRSCLNHVLQDALKRQKEECKEWTSHSNRYNKKIEQKIIALITLGVPQQLFCVCPGTLKASSRPSDDIHRPSHKLPALVRDHALSLARNRNKSSEVFYLLKWNEKFPSFNKVFWGGQPSIWGNFIKGSSRRDERSRREKRILTQHFVRVVHTKTVIRWDILALSWVTIF